MKIIASALLVLFLAFAATSAFVSAKQSQHKMTKADVDRLMTELSNWGRWGKDDQLGAINLITAAPIPLTGGTGSPLNPIATF